MRSGGFTTEAQRHFDSLAERDYTASEHKETAHGDSGHSFQAHAGGISDLQEAQDDLFDKVDKYEAALLGLTEMVSHNGERIEALEQRVDIIDGKLDAIIEHLQVPYKPPMGFTKK